MDILLFLFLCQYVQYLEKKFLWCAYWVGLGILSSVGLGTGLHTFLLYLVRFQLCYGRGMWGLVDMIFMDTFCQHAANLTHKPAVKFCYFVRFCNPSGFSGSLPHLGAIIVLHALN